MSRVAWVSFLSVAFSCSAEESKNPGGNSAAGGVVTVAGGSGAAIAGSGASAATTSSAGAGGATSPQAGSGTAPAAGAGPSSAGTGGMSATTGLGGAAGHSGSAGQAAPGAGMSGELDAFGIRKLYPPSASGAEWTSEHWASGSAYAITGRTDARDPLAISGMRGTGTLHVTGTGELILGGSEPRIYIYPSPLGAWRDLEITVYYRRVTDSATAYAGLVVGARSGADGHTSATPCDAHTYYARLRHDGAIDFEKEMKHPASSTRQRVAPNVVWPPDGALPFDVWIGWKFVIYNLPAEGGVKLEAYRDLTGGVGGGDWQLMNETRDEGDWSVETDCAAHAPSGGESSQAVLTGGTTFIRNTGVTEARYRWVSVREIAP